MSGVDISDLKKEKLADGKFPAKPKADFRFHMTEAVHKDIQDHAKADKSVEICGVLVGKWAKDENGPFALVTENIRCDSATSKFAEVTFTHESWSQINQEMDTKYSDLRIIGWYHSHPDFGIFLSDRDVFIHENFFSGAGQVAYVVDPVRDLEGVFTWHNGKPEPISHYWIGDRIRTVDAVTRSTAPRRDQMSPADVPGAAPQTLPEDPGMLPFLTTLLAWVAVFLLGYLIAGWRTQSEYALMKQGAVAHFANTKLLKPRFEENMTKIQSDVAEIHNELQKLPAPTADLSREELEKAAQSRQAIAKGLQVTVQNLEMMKNLYGLSPAERQAWAELMEELATAQVPNVNAETKAKKTKTKENVEQDKKSKAVAKPEPAEKKPETKADEKATESSPAPDKAETSPPAKADK